MFSHHFFIHGKIRTSLHLLAVNIDGYPAGAALCHNLMFWQKWFKRPSQGGTV